MAYDTTVKSTINPSFLTNVTLDEPSIEYPDSDVSNTSITKAPVKGKT